MLWEWKKKYLFLKVEFHKIDELSNLGHAHGIKKNGSKEYEKKNIKNFNVPSEQITA